MTYQTRGGEWVFTDEPRRVDEPIGGLFDGVDHDGETYEPTKDQVRLNAQTQRVYDAMRDGAWRTLAEVAQRTQDPEASVSARLRDLRKAKFGGHTVERRRRSKGLWEYSLEVAL